MFYFPRTFIPSKQKIKPLAGCTLEYSPLVTSQSLSRMLQRSLALLVPLLAIALADKSYHGYKVTLTIELQTIHRFSRSRRTAC